MSDEVIVYETGEGPERPLVERINQTLNRELADPKVVAALLGTTFKGLDATKMKQALMEGMIRGFHFKDFLQKDVYAIPYSNGYSLMTSIDHARKRGMRNDVIGKSAPAYVMDADGKKIVSCSITIKRLVKGHIGEYTAEVYFDEYTTGKNLWSTKPRTMIAKVAEMHALRMACPEELSHIYVEEEFESEVAKRNRFADATTRSAPLKMNNLLKDAKKENGKEKQGQDEAEQTAGGDEAQEDNATPPD
jgi:hypothetical protein